MATRREFLQAGIAVPLGAAVLSSATLPSSETPTSPSAPASLEATFYRVVFDKRFPDSLAFADEMQRRGAVIHGISGDITDLWYRDIHPRWQTSPVAVAGLTAHGPLFCLERLAWDHGMRVIFRAEHQYRPDACVEHLLAAPEGVLGNASALADAGPNWGAHVASMVSRCSQNRPQRSHTVVTAEAHSASIDRDPLFSWVIAPVVRA